MRRPFDPAAHDLDSSFRLTRLSDLKGCGCKVPQGVLSKLLGDIFTPPQDEPDATLMFLDQQLPQRIGATGLSDCTVTPLKHDSSICLVQTADYLYPLIDDPYMMGMIACASVLSHLYATGVTECDNILMLLGISSRITQKERDVIAPLMIRGFKDAAEAAGVSIQGGQTVVNPWMLMGGMATSVIPKMEYIPSNNAQPGDVLVLTKPLGTHIACTANQWLYDDKDKWGRIKVVISEEETKKAFQRAMSSMARLNRTAALMMRQFNAHGATDIAGYGLLGHAQSLAKIQMQEVDFVIHNLPVIAKMANINKVVGNIFNLTQGQSPETSGGLLIVFPREEGAAFAKKMEQIEGIQSWIIGVVQKGTRTARVIDKPRVIEVPMKENPNGDLW